MESGLGHDHGGHRHDHGGHRHDHERRSGHERRDGHEHGAIGRWARLRDGISDVVGGHSHDSADQIDDALEADAAGRRALLISLAGLGATAGLQAVVVALSGSVALLGDTLHNVADALTAVPLLIAFAVARRPATARFTYGFGRAEDLAGLAVLAMITLSCALATWASIYRLVHPEHVDHLGAVAAAAVVGFVGNEIVARYRIRVGHQIGSAALVADGLHARTDGFTSLAVLFGAAGVAAGWRWADPVVGLAITAAILGVLRSAVRVVGARLMDAVDPDVVTEATDTLLHTEGVEAVRELRLRWIGHTLRAEADITVDPDLTLAAAHDVAHAAEAHLLRHIRRLSAATIHTSPARHHPTAATA
ncbi:cation diffusion facilitator family transporter [Frankia torreyi]|uniref:Cation diffusion facilitator family transporter n=3 Tax=Frankia TaxID=1854 RepID=A0A0D8B758_9ACTN|nr:cation diffusion facilitator family transporter [Frankia torreyi]KQC38848.1 cation diffusion facilitator family transporter [Frankia sp. ACN1ag]